MSFISKDPSDASRHQLSQRLNRDVGCKIRRNVSPDRACPRGAAFSLLTCLLFLLCLVIRCAKVEAQIVCEMAPEQSLMTQGKDAMRTNDERPSADETAVKQGPPPPNEESLDPALETLRRCIMLSNATCASRALSQIHGPIKDSPACLALEARMFLLQRRRDEALAAIHRAVEMEPKRYSFRMIQGEIYQSFNDQDSAIRSFLLASQLRPHSSETFYFLGMSFFFLDEYARAAKHFQEAIELDPRNHRAVFMLGVSNMVTFKLPEAKAYFEQALKLQPNNPFYHLHYGTLLGRMGDMNTAIQQVKTAERLDSTYALTHYNLGHLYKEAGKYEVAKDELEKSVKLRPDLAEAYYQLGVVYHRLGMEGESRKAYQDFQKLSIEQKQKLLDPVESNVIRHEP